MKPTAEQLSQWGSSLREIDPGSLIPDEDGGLVRWFLGDNGTELFSWAHADAPPHHLQLVFARVSVEWSAEKGLTTGTFKAGSSTAGGRYDPYLLSIGQEVDAEVCKYALALLRASLLEPGVVAPLLSALAARE